MEWWLLSAISNALVSTSYLAISLAIFIPLIRSGQARSNRLGTATAAIFFTCSIGHFFHAAHPLLPLFETNSEEGLAARNIISWHDALWDLTTAAVGIYYLSLRRSYDALIRSPAMFEDLAARQRLLELETAAQLAEVRQRGASELRKSEERFRLAFEHAPIGIALIGLKPENAGQVIRANAAFCALLGRSAEELTSGTLLRFTHPEDRAQARHRLQQTSAGEIVEYADSRRLIHADGRILSTSMTSAVVSDDDGKPSYLVAQFEDVTARREAERLLTRQALHDALTGLPNRILLMDRIDHALSRARRRNTGVAVFFLDMDGFKTVNDTLGHNVGDLVLVDIARRLTDNSRTDDTVGRLGGDEFVVLCEDVTEVRSAEVLAERLLAALNAPYEIVGEKLRLTASLGIALSNPESTPEDLLRDADTAMYRAKETGRARYAVYDKGLRDDLNHRLRTERELRHGIQAGELSVRFQPIVRLPDETIRSVEALVRWEHPTRGTLTPDAFFDVALASGLIVPIGRWMTAEACRGLAHWQATDPSGAPEKVAVNMCALELSQPDAVQAVMHALTETGLPPEALTVEITETVLLDANSSAAGAVKKLSQLGIGIALDDFGTGYSSLTYLKRFPVDLVKIDRSFVAGLGPDTEDTAIVRAVIGLARSLGIETVAEGVERRSQHEDLRELGCSYAQGYLYSPPVPLEALIGQERKSPAVARD